LDDKQLDYIEERFILDNLGDNRTAAEKKYEEIRQQREEERLKKRAALTHKQKVEKLNEYLASLSEHYDVPKVSWTK
jgi:protein FAM32A